MIIKHFVSTNLLQNINIFLGIYIYIYIYIIILIFFVTEFQNHGNEHDHGLLWIKMHLCMECTQMKKLNSL